MGNVDSKATLRLLIVEDNPADVKLIVAVLKRAGYPLHFDVVERLDEFQQRLAEASYDAILCDHNLCDWTGTDALEILRSSGKDTPFIVVTAALGDEAAVEYIKQGAADYVLKHRLERLAVVLDRALRERQHRLETARLNGEILLAKREWELTFDTVPDPVALLDEQYRVKRVNRAFAELVGLEFPELLGRTWCEVLHGALPPPPNCPHEQMLQTGKTERGELLVGGKIVEATASPLRDSFGSQRGCVCVMRDVTERKRAEEALRQSEARFRSLVESNIIGVVVADLKGRITSANDAFLKMVGYSREDLLLGKIRSDQMTPPAYRDLDRVANEKLLQSGAATPWEKEYIRKDGSTVPVLIGMARLEDSDQECIAFVLDVTENKRAEQAVMESEAKYRDLFERAGDAIVIFEPETEIILEANRRACQIYGFEREELVGMSLKRLTKDVARGEERMRHLLQTGSLENYETVRFNKRGESIELLSSATVIDYCGRTAILSISRDITERKRAEQALRESEARLAEAQRLAQLGSWELDLLTKELRWSAECFRLFGIAPAEFRGTEEAFFSMVHPADVDLVRARVRAALEDGATYDVVHRIIRPDASERVVRELGEVVRDKHDRAVRVVGTVQDITEQRKLEEQLQQAQKMEAVGRLAGGVAHDFNNMLMVISGYSELLLDKMASEDSMRHSVSEIKNAADRAAVLTRQLLAFSRKQALQPIVLNLNETVSTTEKMLRRLIGEDIELIALLDPKLGRVNADPGQMEQVLVNLVVNARDAMPRGGRLVIETRNVELDESYSVTHPYVEPGPYVMIAVTDNGCGIDRDTQARIFEPFFTTKELGKGTGLGLSTVYGIVKQSGGHIAVYSEPGHGATFKTYLPRDDRPIQERARPAALPAGGTETILLVEDEERVRKLIGQTLWQKGYTVLEAGNGMEAIQILEHYQKPIHLLMTDTIMPHMSGPQLAERVASMRPEMKVLFMSGYADDAVIHHGLLQTGVAFLQKPFSVVALAHKLREVLGDANAKTQ